VSTTHKEQVTLELLASYRRDLERYAQDCLLIRDKDSKLERFPGFNTAQRYVHEQIEAQREKTGKVRAIVLKGRQQGISTYTAIRFYNRATLHRGVGVYILSHEQTASDKLFKMVDRFQVHNPLRPMVGASNVKELEFKKLDSFYEVATAGQKAGGRGGTVTLFHGSEVAFWQSADDHFSSSVQGVPDRPGTEIILESTASGASGAFYERWNEAMAGEGDYIPIFVPWFWQEEYRREVPYDFELSTDPGDTGMSEKEYAALFDLSFEQMAWRRAKVAELRSVMVFDREYPATPALAFTSADVKQSFILPIQVLRARKRKDVTAAGPLIIGADPSGPGKDRFAVAARQGCRVLWIDHRQVPETPEAVEWLRQLIDDHKPDRLYIDLANIGHAVYTYLRAKGEPYRTIVRGINFGATSQAKLALPKVPGPKNRRAEMWDRSREWLLLPEGVQLPDNDALQADATAPRVKPLLNNDFLLESKEDMRRRGVRSPDLWDAVILTFAELERIVHSEQRLKDEQKTPSLMPAFTTPAPSSGAFQLPAGSPNGWMA
jgi:hypothetical protein